MSKEKYIYLKHKIPLEKHSHTYNNDYYILVMKSLDSYTFN